VNEGVGAGVMVNVVVRLGVGTFVFEVVFVQVQGCVWVLPVEIVGVSVIDRVGAGVIVNESDSDTERVGDGVSGGVIVNVAVEVGGGVMVKEKDCEGVGGGVAVQVRVLVSESDGVRGGVTVAVSVLENEYEGVSVTCWQVKEPLNHW